MTSRNSTGKKPRFSYGERVLSAFIKAQKDHRKGSVHTATLRATVKKMATSRKDKLGPRWMQWVGKAIRKLEDEGIFQPALPQGSLALTDEGRKLIADVRRELPPGANAATDGQQEDIISRSVNRSLGSVRLHGDDTTTTSITVGGVTSPGKRGRRSSGRTSMKSMTKAQLQATYAALEEERQRERLLRDTSPLTDLDTGEREADLQHQLKQRELEMEELRRKLDEPENRDVFNSPADHFGTRTATPTMELDTPDFTSTPAAPSRLNRSLSGAVIPEHSKQPTPAPSVDGTEDELPQLHDQQSNAFGNHSGPGEVEKLKVLCELQQSEVGRLTVELERVTTEQEAYERELRTQNMNAVRLQEDRDASQARVADLEQSLNNYRERAKFLTSRIAELEARSHEADTLHIALQQTSQNLAEMELQATALEEALDAVQAELGEALEDKDSYNQLAIEARRKFDEMGVEKVAREVQIAGLSKELQRVKIGWKQSQQQKDALEAQFLERNDELEALKNDIMTLEESVEEIMEAKTRDEETILLLKEAYRRLKREFATLDEVVENAAATPVTKKLRLTEADKSLRAVGEDGSG